MAKKLLLFLILLLPIPASSTLYLKERLALAKPGDYIVTAQKRTVTLWSIRAKEPGRLFMEEISLLASERPESAGWREWVAKEAPGHSSWLLYALNLTNGELIGLYSFDKERWCEVESGSNFLTTLLNLPFEAAPLAARRRIGQAPSSPLHDSRPYWEPPLPFEGKILPEVAFDLFQARWPGDESELAGKLVEIYLPREAGVYPSYFPYWLQVTGQLGQARIRIIDSGNSLLSPKPLQLPASGERVSLAASPRKIREK